MRYSTVWLIAMVGLLSREESDFTNSMGAESPMRKPVLQSWFGSAPVIDGIIAPGEWDDGTEIRGVIGWTAEFSPVTDDSDLALKGWVKHDAEQLYFGFEIMDDVLYGIDTERWLPKENAKAHELSREGYPWFGDEMEILLNASNSWSGDEDVAGDASSWQMVCNLTKSRLGGIGQGGLLEGEPRSSEKAWQTYQRWIREGAQRAAVMRKSNGRGYVIEWAIRFDRCVEIAPGTFYSPNLGAKEVGLNLALGDLDTPARGEGNFGNFHHEQWWAGARQTRTRKNNFGTLRLMGRATRIKAAERLERFDSDPNWDGHNHRIATKDTRRVKQDFGFSPTQHAGGQRGEMGGFISTAAEPAYYGKWISERTLEDELSASGTLVCGTGPYQFLIGFFNHHTVNEWRTANSVAIRISGRGDRFFAYVEYATGRWEAGADSPGGFATVRNPETGRMEPKGFSTGPVVYEWSLKYDPRGNGGNGSITVRVGNEISICHLDPGHKASGAVFNRFGLLNVTKSADGGGEVWLDNLTINGEREAFDQDPEWDEFQNRREYLTTNVRPWFNFGFTPTHWAGGLKPGEIGGIIFRGDNRYPERLAYYGARLELLNLEKPLRASGKVTLRRGVTDSTSLIGFFHSKHSVEVSPSQSCGFPKNFLGIAIEGPSSDGFFFYPAYRVNGEGNGNASGTERPRIYPDGAVHEWQLEYDPGGGGGAGMIRVRLGTDSCNLGLEPEDRKVGAQFDRFGIVTTWIDGNGQHVYYDDLSYTWRQD